MKILVIDDDLNIRETLVTMLKTFCKGITEVAQADDIYSGKIAINSFKPDLLFIDVELKDKTAMDLLSDISDIDFQIIFITAYQKYAIDAFKFSAIDFLLKPIDPTQLIKATEKAKEYFDQSKFKSQYQVLLNYLSNPNKNNKIVLKDNESIYFVPIKDIIYCEADGSYTTFNLIDSEAIMISKTLKEYDDLLFTHGFIRTHQSFIVNKAFVKKFEKHTDSLVLQNGKEIPVSQRKKDAVLAALKV
jgi:two-component system LytT family response regulator